MAIKFKFLEAGSGDSIFISTKKTNVLIDGGDSGTFELGFLDEVGIIDIMILTHYDRDHIDGLIDLLEYEKIEILENPNYISKIKEVWANSFVKAFPYVTTSNNTSKQDLVTLLDFIRDLKGKIQLKDNFSVNKQRHFKHQDLKFILLSPNDEQLAKILPIEIEKYEKDNLTANIIQTSSKDCEKSIATLAENKDDKLDTSIPNSLSIAFILVYKEKNYLFLGDAHIKSLTKELKDLQKQYNKFHNFEFIKLSHHGSRNNITKEFIQSATTKNYVILTNGKRHGHPDKETLSKILVYRNNKNDKINFIVNYENIIQHNKFTSQDKKDYNFEVICKNEYP